MSSPRHGLVRLCAATVALLATGLAMVLLARLRWADTADLSFHGWQVDAVQTVLGVLLLACAGAAALAFRGPWRALSGKTPLRAPLVVVAALAGLSLGSLSGFPMARAVTWASEHTAAATAAQEQYRAWTVNDGPIPALEMDPWARPAPAEAVARLLRPQDLGPDWFDTQHPNPYALKVVPTVTYTTPVARARLSLTQHHRVEGRWHRDHLLWEEVLTFASGAQAQESLARYLNDGSAKVQQVRGVQVWEGRYAAFVLGRDLYLVKPHSVLDGPLTKAQLHAVSVAAVWRAQSA